MEEGDLQPKQIKVGGRRGQVSATLGGRQPVPSAVRLWLAQEWAAWGASPLVLAQWGVSLAPQGEALFEPGRASVSTFVYLLAQAKCMGAAWGSPESPAQRPRASLGGRSQNPLVSNRRPTSFIHFLEAVNWVCSGSFSPLSFRWI